MKHKITHNGIKIQSAVLYYIMNHLQNNNIEIKCADKKLTCHPDGEELVKVHTSHGNKYGIKFTESGKVEYVFEPFYVEEFPDKDNTLKFECGDLTTTPDEIIDKTEDSIYNINLKTIGETKMKLLKKIYGAEGLIYTLTIFVVALGIAIAK